MSLKAAVANVGLIERQSLHATVIRACKACGAPGQYHDVPDVNAGCFNPARKGQPVGGICPNCGAERPGDEDKGEIWRRDVTIWNVLAGRIKEIFTKGKTQ